MSHGVRRRILLTSVVCIAVAAVALIWGSALKRQSDAYLAASEADIWTVSADSASRTAEVPDFRGGSISPGGDVPSVPGDASGVVITLSEDSNGQLGYAFSTASAAGLSVSDGAPTPEAEISRLHREGLRVLGFFSVQCLNDAYRSDPSAEALRRGVELSLLTSAAQAGIDELLLLDVPYGDDDADGRTLEFLNDLNRLTADCGTLLGVALPANAFVRVEGETTPNAYALDEDELNTAQYTGWRTPGRMLSACDFLALDARLSDTDSVGELLRGFRYAYERYALRLLLADSASSALADSHGMSRQILLL